MSKLDKIKNLLSLYEKTALQTMPQVDTINIITTEFKANGELKCRRECKNFTKQEVKEIISFVNNIVLKRLNNIRAELLAIGVNLD